MHHMSNGVHKATENRENKLLSHIREQDRIIALYRELAQTAAAQVDVLTVGRGRLLTALREIKNTVTAHGGDHHAFGKIYLLADQALNSKEENQ
jgi:hypothetical protein